MASIGGEAGSAAGGNSGACVAYHPDFDADGRGDAEAAIDVQPVEFFQDLDADGTGEPLGEDVCVGALGLPPPGWARNGLDCDDGQLLRSPVLPELPDDGLDNNCDSSTNTDFAAASLPDYLSTRDLAEGANRLSSDVAPLVRLLRQHPALELLASPSAASPGEKRRS